MTSYIDDDAHGDFTNQPRVFDGARWDRISKDFNNLDTSGTILLGNDSGTSTGVVGLGGDGKTTTKKTKKVSPMPPILVPFTSLTSFDSTTSSSANDAENGSEKEGNNISSATSNADQVGSGGTVTTTTGDIVMDGTIFVSVVSFRDSKRCGMTIKSIFDQAKVPSRVIVGLVDQVNTEEREKTCIDEYCALYDGMKGGRKFLKDKCPRYNQIREIGMFSKGSAGPGFARSLQRKNLSNEEFCMQVDAHTNFVSQWDVMSIEEWKATNNEYGVISTVPPNESKRAEYSSGGNKQYQVPRICQISFSGINLPMFTKDPCGIAEHIPVPLLSHSWCAGFSFAKCHLEEAAPYDSFLPQIFDGEEFPRYARMWTRGYDVYTPTRNIVFHKDGPNPNSQVDPKGWPRRDVLRNESIKRIKTLLNMQGGGDTSPSALANMGLLGLGKRRTLDEFQTFVGVDLREGTGGRSTECGLETWVPYDYTKYSALDNLYDHAQNLDPQPEYPLRTIHTHTILDTIANEISSSTSTSGVVDGSSGDGTITASNTLAQLLSVQTNNNNIPASIQSSTNGGTTTGLMGNPFIMFVCWVLGIVLWYFAHTTGILFQSASSTSRRGRSRSTRPGGRNNVAASTAGAAVTSTPRDLNTSDTNGSHKSV